MRRLERAFGAPMLSPAGLALRACLLWLAFGLVHALGLREYTTVLSGTPVGGLAPTLGGVFYVILDFGAVVAAPIALIAGVLLLLVPRATPSFAVDDRNGRG